MPHNLETEFKLRATRPIEVAAVDAALREAGLACRSTDASRHVDTYLDDASGSLAAAGIGLRLREDRLGCRITCKTKGRRDGALFVREEHDASWPAVKAPRLARELPPPLRDMVEPFVLTRALEATLRLETQRDARALQAEERDLCELMIDQVRSRANGREATFVEVEVEVLDDLPGCERLCAELEKRLPLAAAEDDKPSHAATLLGLGRPAAAAPPLHADAATGEAVAAILARHLHELRTAEVGVRTDLDPSFLHSMRVSLRRLRSVVRAFRELWSDPDQTWILDHLAAVSRELGGLRDLDVMVENLVPAIDRLPDRLHGAGAAVVDWVKAQRNAAHAHLQSWLRTPQRLAEAERLQSTLLALQPDSELAAAPLCASVAPRLAKAVSSVRKCAVELPADLPLEPLHKLRIASKRLRYLAEEFQGLPGHDYARSLRAVTRLQQTLGTVCDHEVTASRLLGWVQTASTSLPEGALAAAALGGLATRHVTLAQKGRKAATRRLAKVDRKKVWRQFPGDQPTAATLAP